MSQWGGGSHLQKQPPSNNASPGPSSPAPASPTKQPSATTYAQPQPLSPSQSNFAQSVNLDYYNENASPSPGLRSRSDSRASRASSRPMSMIQTYQPPVMDIDANTLPELHRIFSFFNSHSNKLYQEGYFLKFHDTDSRTSSQCVELVPICVTDSMQVAGPRQTGNGRSTLCSWSAPYSRCGTPARSIRPAATRRCYRPSST